ncbi:Piso0_001205 [Millerozyma farinosa CBS 7064]|uniref:Piso0_001205 protein n=1 Tax=Pichia sorbitophila (strain ATCC MYA-4447 / BCRC 22081 / CBS 7064 / NBRC 10061 / NRRL Y-12695) TaxID=559304 RepID=G8YSP1_PICSO|nr:Piso0_001205 [Millerozyma farinosa CBS 7064]CCE79164.1 Piso0_001205 [Millerozyma farinosa CBS 7064]
MTVTSSFIEDTKNENVIEIRINDFSKKDLDQLKELFLEYSKELGIDLSFQGFQEECDNILLKYSPAVGGDAILLYDGSEAAGCVALRKIDHDTCEMKRLFVRNKFRSKKFGYQLASSIIKIAKKLGYKSMKLDTLSSLTSAIRLYKSLGFSTTDPYIYNPIEEAEFYELKL